MNRDRGASDESNPRGSQTRCRPGLSADAILRLTLDAHGRLVLTSEDGQSFVGLEAARAFPLSDPSRWISLVDPDGRELVCLESLERLDAESRSVLEEELRLREFLPVVRRILAVSSDSTPCEWNVDTDRGPTRFTLESEEDIRYLGGSRVLIADSNRVRYQIRDVRVLDTFSRRLLERFV